MPHNAGMDFNAEIQAAFAEIGERAMPTPFRLTNESHTGVIRSMETDDELTEAGIDSKSLIVVTCVQSQFSVPPETFVRELLTVEQGPFVGTWVVIRIQNDNAHHHFMCALST